MNKRDIALLTEIYDSGVEINDGFEDLYMQVGDVLSSYADPNSTGPGRDGEAVREVAQLVSAYCQETGTDYSEVCSRLQQRLTADDGAIGGEDAMLDQVCQSLQGGGMGNALKSDIPIDTSQPGGW